LRRRARQLSVPLVVRPEAPTWHRWVLAKSNLPIIAADNLADAAEKIVRAAR
jgi:succinyl-CoA synthetase beta subunit